MSWNKLNGSELQAVRKLLMLDVSDAARLIGRVSNRTWQYWESGRSKVPDDVDMETYGLAQLRLSLIDELTEQLLALPEDERLELPYYHTFECWSEAGNTGNEVEWRIHQAAVAQIFSEEDRVSLNAK